MNTLRRKKSIGLCCLFVMGAFVVIPALAGPDDDSSVYNYAINWAVQTGTTEVTVEAQARYCSACNPNWAGNPGPAPFSGGSSVGTCISVRIKDSGGTVLGTQKLVLQSGVNLTLNTICTWQFVFTGLAISAGDTLTVEADTYCSWCGHWYPSPFTLIVQAANSQVTYTGDTSALVGTNANVSATLVDAGTGNPLGGKTITFTLNPPSPIAMVSAVTNASGVAATTMAIPASTLGGTYTMDTRFAGDASYFPCSDQDPFTVIVNRPPVAVCQGAVVAIGEVPDIDGGSYDPDGDTITYSQNPSGAFDDAGIYQVELTVTDSHGASDSCTAMVVVYDPSAGFVTGGGWIDSPAGAYTPDPDLTGKANFGFVSKYKKGATTPTGNTEFQFHAGDLNFHSSSYEWLVVTGSDYARFKGSGTINGMGDYKFMLWARDSAPDTFRIRIWTEDDGSETVEYDNGSDQAVGSGSIIIHTIGPTGKK